MTFLDFIMFLLDGHTKAYPSNFAFTIFSSDVQTSSSIDQAFKLRLHMNQMFRLYLHHIYHFQFRCSDFVFCISDVQTSFASHLLVTIDQTFRLRLLHIRRSDFTFI